MGRHEEECRGTSSGMSATAARAGRSQHIPVPAGTARLRGLQSQRLSSHVALAAGTGSGHLALHTEQAGTGRLAPAAWPPLRHDPEHGLGDKSHSLLQSLLLRHGSPRPLCNALVVTASLPGSYHWLGSALLLPHGIHSSCSWCRRELLPLRESHWLQVPSRAAPGPGALLSAVLSPVPCKEQRACPNLPTPACQWLFPCSHLPDGSTICSIPGWQPPAAVLKIALVRGNREGKACLAEEVTPAGREQGCLPEKLEDLTAFPLQRPSLPSRPGQADPTGL